MRALITLTFLVSAALISASAQLGPSTDLPEEPQVFNEAGQQFRVVPIHGLEQPWALAFLPSGDILVTERRGRLRIVRDGMLDPEPIAGIPEVTPSAIGSGLMDVARCIRSTRRTSTSTSPTRSRCRGTPTRTTAT